MERWWDVDKAVSRPTRSHFGELTYDRYLQEQGIDLAKPIVLVGVSAKLDEKRWPLKYMAFITQRLIARRPEANVSKLPNGGVEPQAPPERLARPASRAGD